MGDRCYMAMNCRECDGKAFQDLGFIFEGDRWFAEEANYAHYNELPLRVPYHGTSGSGSNYGPSLYACDGVDFAQVESNHDGIPVVVVQLDGKAAPADLADVQRYRKLQSRAEIIEKLPPGIICIGSNIDRLAAITAADGERYTTALVAALEHGRGLSGDCESARMLVVPRGGKMLCVMQRLGEKGERDYAWRAIPGARFRLGRHPDTGLWGTISAKGAERVGIE